MVKVLVVDDKQEIRRLFAEALQADGHDVELAENGVQCLARARIFQPDVIVLDVFMPDKDGVETLYDLRRLGSPAKVIACSGGGLSENYDFLELTQLFGADLVLRKPILPDQLAHHVRQCLSPGQGG